MRPILARWSALALALAVVCAWTTPVFPQVPTGKPAIKMETAKQTPPTSGPVMFREYCAACHGPGGEGNGPAAAALKTPPANLTLLAQKNKGTFPQKHVEDVLQHGVQYAAHGTSEMPVWGPTLRALSSDSQVLALRIANLTEFVRSLQK